MKTTKTRRILASICFVTGALTLGLLVFLIWWTVENASNSTTAVFVVGVIATLLSPIGFAALQAGWRQLRPPSLDLVRRQKEAAVELEKAVREWEFADSQRELADTTRAEIEIYIRLRTRSLYLESRRDLWQQHAEQLFAEYQQLAEQFEVLGRSLQTEISAPARAFLDEIVDRPKSPWIAALEYIVRNATGTFPLVGGAASVAAQGVMELTEFVQRRRERREAEKVQSAQGTD
jgi:hypothetical protein